MKLGPGPKAASKANFSVPVATMSTVASFYAFRFDDIGSELIVRVKKQFAFFVSLTQKLLSINRPDTSRRQRMRLPPLPHVIALVP